MAALEDLGSDAYSHPRNQEASILGTDDLGSSGHVPASLGQRRVDYGQRLLADSNPVPYRIAIQELFGIEPAKSSDLDLARYAMQQVCPAVIFPESNPLAARFPTHAQAADYA